MQGKAILCRPKSGNKGKRGCLATSVMLLDCTRLTHWKFDEQFEAMFRSERDYMKWMCLQYEDRDSIGFCENEWNDFDHLTERTKMLHTTKRKHQPWKTGLPIDYRPADVFQLFPPRHWLRNTRRLLFGDYGLLGTYGRHPDRNQENFFFGLVRECLDQGIVSEQQLRRRWRSITCATTPWNCWRACRRWRHERISRRFRSPHRYLTAEVQPGCPLSV